jgi:hypothetical protein
MEVWIPYWEKAKKTSDYIAKKSYVDYGTYVKLRGKLKM